jgi:hypothetical protein
MHLFFFFPLRFFGEKKTVLFANLRHISVPHPPMYLYCLPLFSEIAIHRASMSFSFGIIGVQSLFFGRFHSRKIDLRGPVKPAFTITVPLCRFIDSIFQKRNVLMVGGVVWGPPWSPKGSRRSDRYFLASFRSPVALRRLRTGLGCMEIIDVRIFSKCSGRRET